MKSTAMSFLLNVLVLFSCFNTPLISPASAAFAPDARLMRFPDVSKNKIVFVYAGDIWTVNKTGGTAQRLTTSPSWEFFPKFSPNGQKIAFSGNYDGNTDVYIIPTTGGIPQRITHNPSSELVVDWYPDAKNILYRSTMDSPVTRFDKFFKQPVTGGLPQKLPLPYAELASFNANGTQMAFQYIDRDFRNWKRYRGGMASNIWIYNTLNHTTKQITTFTGTDTMPMWHNNFIYFLSDRGRNDKLNLWRYDINKQRFTQITHFRKYDIKFASAGPDDIVLTNGGQLYTVSLKNEKLHNVPVIIPSDLPRIRKQLKDLVPYINQYDVSPTGKRAVFSARGEILTVPAKYGVTRNLTRTSGIAERYCAWSPNGKYIAYFSDKTGEYELYLQSPSGKTPARRITFDGKVFRYSPLWSPDSKSIAFSDKTGSLYVVNIKNKKPVFVDRNEYSEMHSYNWSHDSRYLTYTKGTKNHHDVVMIWDSQTKKTRQVTSNFYDNSSPVFSVDGKYLFFLANTRFTPKYGDMTGNWIYPNSTELYALTLRKDVKSPLALRDDEEPQTANKKEVAKNSKTGKESPDNNQKSTKNPCKASKNDTKPTKKNQPKVDKNNTKTTGKTAKITQNTAKTTTKKIAKKTIKIDFEGIDKRIVKLPVRPGHMRNMATVRGKVLYMRYGSGGGLYYYDIAGRREIRVISGISGYSVSANGKKLMYHAGSTYGITDITGGRTVGTGRLNLSNLKAWIEPQKEWHQMFVEAWRIERDFFYDPKMHGLNWQAIRSRYEPLVKYLVDRQDLNYLIGQMLGELNCSHSYVHGGDLRHSRGISVGMLGCDYRLDKQHNLWQISKIYDSAPWSSLHSPLREPGVNVNEGDYLLAVNGVKVSTDQDPWAAFQNMAGQTITITVNSKPTFEKARDVLVRPLPSEAKLRYLAWIENNRKKVDKATNGRVGYVYVLDTTREGQNELVRQFTGQQDKQAMIIDERFNAGGQLPDRFIELLNRPTLCYWALRDFKDWKTPRVSIPGPKVMLINSWSGSGGDAFPYFFRKTHLGPLVGTRTWGGLVGISGNPQLIDGGYITAPKFAIWNTQGQWIIEGYGVAPDYKVPNIPHVVAEGKDEQLDKAIEVIMNLLKKNYRPKPHRPAYRDKSH